MTKYALRFLYNDLEKGERNALYHIPGYIVFGKPNMQFIVFGMLQKKILFKCGMEKNFSCSSVNSRKQYVHFDNVFSLALDASGASDVPFNGLDCLSVYGYF